MASFLLITLQGVIIMDEKIIDYYNKLNEEKRLFMDYNHTVEYITNMAYIKNIIKKNSKVLDICAGSGNYSFKLAKSGHEVTAGGFVENQIDILEEKQKNNAILSEICKIQPTDLSKFNDNYFDLVLCIGPFYILNKEECEIALIEALRVLKPSGCVVISYINKNAVCLKTISDNLKNIDDVMNIYNNKLYKDIFKLYNPSEIESLLSGFRVTIVNHFGSDGIGYRIPTMVNESNKEDYNKWLKYHLATCEDKNILGYSLHGTIIIRK